MGKKTLATLSMAILTFLCVSQAFSQGETTLFPGIVRIESGLSIGGVDDYFTFPGARGAANTVIVATDESGTTGWQLIQEQNLQGIGEAAGTVGEVLGSNGAGGFAWVSKGNEGILRLTTAYIAVNVTPDSTALENGQALLAAYQYAVDTLTDPNDEERSATNRATVLLPPGVYDLGTSQLELDTEWVDIVGLTSARENQVIRGETDNGEDNRGVITQMVSDVHLENLTIECTLDSGNLDTDDTDPAAYYPDDDLSLADTIIRNCTFLADEENAWSMRIKVEYDGTFVNCSGGQYAFGGESRGEASGTFIGCTGGEGAFGGSRGSASGTFRDCVGGDGAFGGSGGSASGIFRDCVGGDEAFGGGDGSGEDAVFFNCEGGPDSFGQDGYCAICMTNGKPSAGYRIQE